MAQSGRAAALGRAAQRSVLPVLLANTLIMTLVCVGDVSLMSAIRTREALPLHVASAAASLFLIGIAMRGRLGPRSANAAIAGITLIGLLSAVDDVMRGPGSTGAISFIVLLIAAGALIPSRPWFALVAAPTVVAWLGAIGAHRIGNGVNDLITIVATLSIGVLLQEIRRRGIFQTEALTTELRESEDRWRRLVQNAPDRILTVSLDGRILFLNRTGGDQPVEKAIGHSVFEFVPESDARVIADVFAHVAATGQPGAYETSSHHADGSMSYFKCSVGPIFHEGRVDELMVIATDITKAKEVERERAEAWSREQEIQRLQQLDAFKTQFINTAAHELGTPLTPIRMQLHLLRLEKAGDEPPAQRRSLEILDRNVSRLESLVKDVLDSAKLQSGRLAVRQQLVDVSSIVRESSESFEAQARDRKVTLEWRAEAGLVVEADGARLTQVLFNYISNALKFTQEGGRIDVGAVREDGEVKILVRDTGAGFEPAKAERLFQPFTQIHDIRSLPQVGGTGLGLYICRGIAEQHRGRVWCQSDGPGRGALFGLAIPVAASTVTVTT